MNRNILAVAVGVIMATNLLSDEQALARALVRWQQRPCLMSALHIITSGLFLAEDVAALS